MRGLTFNILAAASLAVTASALDWPEGFKYPNSCQLKWSYFLMIDHKIMGPAITEYFDAPNGRYLYIG